MSDPHSSMSLTAVLVLTVVVIVLLVGWLAVVFRADSQPARRPARRGAEDAGHAATRKQARAARPSPPLTARGTGHDQPRQRPEPPAACPRPDPGGELADILNC